jgi:RHS repeat-associated protein
MKSYRGVLPLSPAWNPSVSAHYDNAYKMALSYDYNGNITSLTRNGPGNNLLSGSSLQMDNLQYGYYNSGVYSQSLSSISFLPYNSNRLRCVSDQVAAGNYGSDIDDIACTDYEYIVSAAGPGGLQMITPGSKRYDYDATGNLIADKGEYIALIEWTLDRKVKRILRDSTRMSGDGITRPDIEYAYNAQRQRVMKLVKPREISTGTLSPAQDWTYTYYVYDASGNLMATYDRVATQLSGSFHRDRLGLLEQPIYGSERLALARPEHSLAAWSYTFDANCISGNGPCRDLVIPGTPPTSSPPTTGTLTERHLGFKDFELNNHLGNVITTVSDRKLPGSYIIHNCVKEFDFTLGLPPQPEINANNMSLSISASGSLVCTMTTNGFISGINPRFGNNLSNTTVYQIDFDFDPGTMTPSDGLYLIPFDLDENFNIIYNGSLFWNYGSVPPAGHYSFTYTPAYTGAHYASYVAFNSGSGSNHFQIANLRMCPLQGAVNSYSADITSHTDYYPFGQTMPGRTWQGGDKYRYSHNGHEKEDEIFNGAQSAEFWMYDSRIGRRWEMDPITYEDQSPYAAFNNNPIYYSDPLGLEGEDPPNTLSGPGAPSTPVGLPEMGATISSGIFADVLSSIVDFFNRGSQNLKESVNKAAIFSVAAANAWSSNQLMGAGRGDPNSFGSNKYVAQAGQLAGDIASVITGTGEMILGIGGEVFGLALDATGVGSVAGVPIGVASAGVIAHGGAVIGVATSNMIQDRVNQTNHEMHGSSSNGNGSGNGQTYKKPKSGVSGKEGAKDVPSWAKGEKPYSNENGKQFAKRLLDKKYGEGNYEKGPTSEFNKIQKWGDRAFE